MCSTQNLVPALCLRAVLCLLCDANTVADQDSPNRHQAGTLQVHGRLEMYRLLHMSLPCSLFSVSMPAALYMLIRAGLTPAYAGMISSDGRPHQKVFANNTLLEVTAGMSPMCCLRPGLGSASQFQMHMRYMV